VVFNLVVTTVGVVCLFLGVARASNENIHNYFSSSCIVYGNIFVVATIIESPGKNDSLLFVQKCFKGDYAHYGGECNYDH